MRSTPQACRAHRSHKACAAYAMGSKVMIVVVASFPWRAHNHVAQEVQTGPASNRTCATNCSFLFNEKSRCTMATAIVAITVPTHHAAHGAPSCTLT
mmetsp:Transcript_39386/g.124164  ORF Transcript_39386/g.124164 Transcript_39386/m.124164 type:complete len:97 (-) Transcript_39386:150-440(-)